MRLVIVHQSMGKGRSEQSIEVKGVKELRKAKKQHRAQLHRGVICTTTVERS